MTWAAELVDEAATIDLSNDRVIEGFLYRWSLLGASYRLAAKMALLCRSVAPNAHPDRKLTGAEMDKLLAAFSIHH